MKPASSFGIFVCLFVLVACSAGQTEGQHKQMARIDSLHKQIQAHRRFDKVLAKQEINACLKFVKTFPDDSMQCAEYLFRVQELSRGIGDYATALSSVLTILNSYPNFYKTPECLFLHGFLCQEYFNDTLSAKLHYQTFVSKYPKHPLVKEAQTLMKLLGKTNDEVIEGFK